MKKKDNIDINYIFFGIFLVITLIISTLNVLTIKEIPFHSKTFFLIYAYGQSILEVFLIAISTFLIQKYLNKFFFYFFISFTFILFIVHVIDYTLFKIMDITFWEGLDIVLDENLENFIEMLHATSIPFFAWIILAIAALFFPLIGIVLYKLCDNISNKRKFPIKKDQLIQTLFCLPLALLILDSKVSSTINPNLYSEYTRTLPWKLTFVQPTTLSIDFPVTLKQPISEKQCLSILDQKDLKIEKKPNIFIFVIESLRSDFITKEIAPTLYKFKEENISFEKSLSNANATHQSWFALFYSNYPFVWKYYKDINWKTGATSLYILKKIGYDINVFSAPELKYYSMKDILFGENVNLTKSFNLFPHYHPKEACESDIDAINEMEKNLKKDQNVYITFFDSTHFLYSWPKDFNAKFKPYAKAEDLNIYTSINSIELVKNRYRNAINFTDSLLNDFFEKLKKQNLWDDSIIVIVGDHGEEFYEEGHLFHASHLSSMQTNVPIYFKLGKNLRKCQDRKLICHMDVFPTILDYLFEKNQFDDLLSGESIFKQCEFPFVITTRFNGARAPYEFFIHTENEKLTLRFNKKKDIFKNQHIRILSYKDKNDNEMDLSSKQKILQNFEKAINRLFQK